MTCEKEPTISQSAPQKDLAAVILDWDGLLVDSMPPHYNFQKYICEITGRPWPLKDYDDHRAKMIEPFPLFYEQVLGFDWERDQAWIDAQYKEFMASQTYDFRPGAIPLLSQVVSVGLPIGIASQSHAAIIDQKLVDRLARGLVGAIVGAEAGLPKKPNPAVLIECAARLSVSPVRCVYIGDTPTDIEAARAAGMAAVGVLGGFSTEEKLRAANPDMVVAKPFEAFRFIQARVPQEMLDLMHIP